MFLYLYVCIYIAYHSAIIGNSDVFKDKVVMDIGTGSGILAAWAAKAGAKRVYAIEYTDMSKHAEKVMKANGIDHIVTVIKGAVEEVVLPDEGFDGGIQCVDIIVSEWMGYFLLRESMLDSVIRARDKFLKPRTGLMFPSHCTMYIAPITDEEERYNSCQDYGGAMQDWSQFAESTKSMYGIDMNVLEESYEREQKEYFMLSSKWAELQPKALLADPQVLKQLDLATCTVEESRGIALRDESSSFDFDVLSNEDSYDGSPISGFAGWFTSDFMSRTDSEGGDAPKLNSPVVLNTGRLLLLIISYVLSLTSTYRDYFTIYLSCRSGCRLHPLGSASLSSSVQYNYPTRRDCPPFWLSRTYENERKCPTVQLSNEVQDK